MSSSSASSPNSGLAFLFQQHRAELARFLAARCGSPDDAQDLLQDLWIRLETHATGPIAHGRAYLFRMANNLVLDRARARQRAMRRDREWLELSAPAIRGAEDRPDPAPSAEQALVQAQEAEVVEAAIAALPPGAQRALRLCRIDGMGQADAARLMGISRSGVEKHLALAMKLLRKRFADCGLLAAATSGLTVHRSGGEALREQAE